ncbi:FAD binding domain-containing protein [Roseomonas chloroacetimidivorans]|uniref:FAD binding domain-containing protein n=1 Tax=Roseomonas chloroacetimidivorans TaxID=1766656 RepID=UPI003C724370
MKPPPFRFEAPRTLAETLSLLAQHGEEARILAGGQSLVPLMNMRVSRPAVLISINHCAELSYVHIDGGQITCGALVRQYEAETSPEIRRDCPLLAEALPLVGSAANRNRGTVCGSLAHADPLAELPAVALALGATFVVNGVSGRREVTAEDFFVAELMNCLAPGEMLEAVRFPSAPAGARAAFVEVGNRRHGFALAGVAAQIETAEDGECRSIRLAVMGAGPRAIRLHQAERALLDTRLDREAIRAAGAMASAAVDPGSDIHADAAYRKQLVGVLVARAISRAMRDHQVVGGQNLHA